MGYGDERFYGDEHGRSDERNKHRLDGYGKAERRWHEGGR
jgi:hypothetical protein